MRVLGIESSCDETAAAVYDGSAGLLSSVVSSQVAVHGAYGGVVPELASREHLKSIVPVVEKALSDASTGRDAIDGIAVDGGAGAHRIAPRGPVLREVARLRVGEAALRRGPP